jgi:UDP-glucose 4-epimerase
VTVLVIGGAGYIGSHASRALRRAGHQVIIFDNLSAGYESLARGFELVKGDVLDRSALARVLPRVEAIMHFAAFAYVGESVTDPQKYFHNNVEGGLSLLNAAL